MKQADRSSAAHPPHQVMSRIVVSLDLFRHRPAGSLVHLGRPLRLQRLVGAQLIELLPESIELVSVCSHVAGRRDGGFLLQCAMHPLVHPILLRLPGFDQLRVDPHLDEPHRQLRQPRQRSRCGRHAIIRSNAIEQPVSVEKDRERHNSLLQRDGCVCIAAQQEAGREIAHGERETIVPVL